MVNQDHIREYIRGKRVTKQRRDKDSGGMLMSATISEVNPYTEKAYFRGSSVATQAQIRHPFVTDGAHFRAMPIAGSHVMLTRDSETGNQHIVSYNYSGRGEGASVKAKAYASSKDLYRLLVPGEMEIKSKGNSLIFVGNEALTIEHKSNWMEFLKSRISANTPTFIVKTQGGLSDESLDNRLMFGVVRRKPITSIDPFLFPIAPYEGWRLNKEWFLNLTDPLGVKKVQLQMFDVVDEGGFPVINPKARSIFSLLLKDKASVGLAVDEVGNVSLETSTPFPGEHSFRSQMGKLITEYLDADFKAHKSYKIFTQEMKTTALTEYALDSLQGKFSFNGNLRIETLGYTFIGSKSASLGKVFDMLFSAIEKMSFSTPYGTTGISPINIAEFAACKMVAKSFLQS